MGAAAAAESPDDTNNATMNSIDDTPLGVSENAGGAEPLLGASNNENILSAGSGSFKDLETYIKDNKGYGKTVFLNQDYAFNNETDGDYNITGIYLGTFTSIDGQGHTIDAKNTSRIFDTIGSEIVLKNIIFTNTGYRAVLVESSSVTIDSCTFINTAGHAVAISSEGENCIVKNSKFINADGLLTDAVGTQILNNDFTQNTNDIGGAIYVSKGDVVIDYCNFTDNTASNYGGAIYLSQDSEHANFYVKNSRFIRNSANDGGAIYTQNAVMYNHNFVSKDHSVFIENCVFEDNVAVQGKNLGASLIQSITLDDLYNQVNSTGDDGKYYDTISEKFDYISGGVVTLDSDYVMTHGPIKLNLFDNLTINGNDHVIDAQNSCQIFDINIYNYPVTIRIENITLKNANTTSNGGAIKIYGNIRGQPTENDFYKVYITNVNFTNDLANNGGAIHMSTNSNSNNPLNITIRNCNFDDCNATADGGAAYITGMGNALLEYCNFKNIQAYNTGAIYVRGGNINFSNFINITAINKNGVFNGPFLSIMNNTIENYTAFSNAKGITQNEINCSWKNGSEMDELSKLLANGGNVTLDGNKIYLVRDPLIFIGGTVLDGNGATIMGMGGNILDNIPSGNISIKNVKIVNATLSNIQNNRWFNLDNVTFENCTKAINMATVKDINNMVWKGLKFNNCTVPISLSDYVYLNISDVTVDGKAYDLSYYQYFNPNHHYINENINLPTGTYHILTTIFIYGKNMVVNCNGSTLISDFGQPIFKIISNNVTLTNFTIKNVNSGYSIIEDGKSGDRPATNVMPKYTQVTNYISYGSFENCSKGAISANNHVTLVIDNCHFDNIGDTTAVLIQKEANVTNCTFNNINGRALEIDHDGYSGSSNVNNIVQDSIFTNIKLLSDNGGAINFRINGTVINCTFENTSAFSGGAIYQNSKSGVVNVTRSSFDGGKAVSSGGAIFVTGTLILDNSTLNDCSADNGGAFFSSGGLNLTNSTLSNNTAVLGGAGVIKGTGEVNVDDCSFEDNGADVAAGLDVSNNNVNIGNSTFVGNNANTSGGAMRITGDNVVVNNITATGNSAPSGAAFVLDGDGVTLANSTVTDNKGVDGEGSAVEVNGENIGILDNTVHGNDGAGVLVNGNGTNITGNTFNSTRDISINPNSDIYNNQTIMNKLQEENYPMGQVEILNDVEPTIIVSDVNVQQKTQFNITIQNNDFKGNVSVKLDDGSLIYNGTFENIKNNNSIIVGPVLPVAGEKTVTVFFYGDPDFNNKTVNTTFIVSRVTPQMNITVANVTYGNNSIVEVRIGNKANGTITITIDDVEITSIPIVNGNATYNLGVLPAGNKTANVQFRYNTSDYYNNNVGNFTSFCVDKAESSISIVVNDTYDIGEDVNITVSTTGSSGNLTFKINDKEYTVVNGTVNITDGLALGVYTITATLDADENYTNAEFTKTFIIKKINTDLILLKK